MTQQKKKWIIGGGIVLILSLIIGVSYAFWQITLTQEDKNIVQTSCFDISFQDSNPIRLENAYPITDEEGLTLIPYEFTIENICDAYAAYQINLEILDSTTFHTLQYIKAKFHEDSPSILTSYPETTPTLENATKSYLLTTGYLDAFAKKTFTLGLWLDYDTPPIEEVMEKTLESKVTIITTYEDDFDHEKPTTKIEVTNLGNKILVNASESSDNNSIKYYYYSLDGKNYVKTEESEYVFDIGTWSYGIATDMLKVLANSLEEEYTVYVKTEDEHENISEIVTEKVIGGLYEVLHDDAEITAELTEEEKNHLKMTEYRYAGKNPYNYVLFNNEFWRIIGLANTPEGQRIKLVRETSLGMYAWDSSVYSINDGRGVNEWSTSKVKELLNEGVYYNRTSGSCYRYVNNGTVACDFSSTGLTSQAKEMIDTITWNTGSVVDTLYHDIYYDINTKLYYNLERSNNIGKNCSTGAYCTDNVNRTTTWKGQVGLIYPSDYGYATSGGSTQSREACLSRYLSSWNSEEASDCKDNDWLYSSLEYRATMIPALVDDSAHMVFFLHKDGNVYAGSPIDEDDVLPSLYLKSNIKIISGLGTKSDPYILE